MNTSRSKVGLVSAAIVLGLCVTAAVVWMLDRGDSESESAATAQSSTMETSVSSLPTAVEVTTTTIGEGTPTTTTPFAGEYLVAPVDAATTISFGSAAGVEIGETIDGFSTLSGEVRAGDCGMADPESVYEIELLGSMTGQGSAAEITEIKVLFEQLRTPSGVGVGTSLAALERIYGSELVIDRADGLDQPTDGLLATYQDVAGIKNGDSALTFLIRNDRVWSIELSSAQRWGDDEGCA